MAGILRRTVFFDNSDGFCRPLDWAMVETGIGTCMEPSYAILPRGISFGANVEWDATDQINRVDEIHNFSLDKQTLLGGNQVHGGTMIPRAGR